MPSQLCLPPANDYLSHSLMTMAWPIASPSRLSTRNSNTLRATTVRPPAPLSFSTGTIVYFAGFSSTSEVDQSLEDGKEATTVTASQG